jgi:hypothetical protein
VFASRPGGHDPGVRQRSLLGGVLACALWASLGAATGEAATTTVVPLPLCCIPSGPVKAVAVAGDTAYVGGAFTRLGLPRHHLAVLDPTTAQPQEGWPGVDGGTVSASVSDGSGGWYLAGTFTSIGGVARDGLAHLLSDKRVDPGWAPTTDGTVSAIARDTGGRVYVGGAFTRANAAARQNVAAFDASGQVTPFSADTDARVDALATSFRFAGSPTSPSTVARLYLGGAFTHVGNVARHYFAAIDLATGTPTGTDPNLDARVTTIAVSGGGAFTARIAYVSGVFTKTTSPALARFHFAAFRDDDATATDWAPSADGVATAMAVSGTTVYLGGDFQQVEGSARTGAAAVDAGTGAVLPWAPDVDGGFFGGQPTLAIRSLAVSGDAVYLAGRFFTVNGKARNNLAAVDPTAGTITRDWDPDSPGYSPAVTHLGFDGSSVLVAGGFGEIGGPARSNLAAVNLATGQVTAFDPEVDGEVDALAVRGTTLYVGGKFTHVGSAARNGAAAVDTGTGEPTGFDPALSGLSSVTVSSLALGDSTVFIAGDFTQAGAAARAGLVEVDAGTGAVTPFHADVDGRANALGYRDGVLYAAGTFTQIGGVARHGFAALQATQDGRVSPFDPQLDDYSSSLLIHGSRLYVGGSFEHGPGGLPRVGMAAFDRGSSSLLPFNPTVDSDPLALADDDTELFAVGPGIRFISGAANGGVGAIDLASGLGEPWTPSLVAGAAPVAVGVSRGAGVVVGGDATLPAGQGVLSAFAIAPSTPAAPQASASAPGEATVSFPSPPSGGAPITRYTVTATPGGQAAVGSASPVVVPGLDVGRTYTFSVSAANAAGEGPASAASNPVTIAAATPPGPGTPGGKSGPKLRASAFKISHKRFRVARARTALVAKAVPKGTRFTFRLSARAVSRIRIERKLRGVRKGKRCVAPRKGLHKRCTRYKRVGTLTRRHTKGGRNKVAFSGRLGKRALRPGSYRATLVATDAGGHRSKPLRVSFAIVRARR